MDLNSARNIGGLGGKPLIRAKVGAAVFLISIVVVAVWLAIGRTEIGWESEARERCDIAASFHLKDGHDQVTTWDFCNTQQTLDQTRTKLGGRSKLAA